MSLVDVYDALRARRPYKEPFDHEKSKAIIVSESATSFEPELIKVFLKIHELFDATVTSWTAKEQLESR